jgi:CHAD domain-containing protein
VKARKVRGLRPDMALGEAARRSVRVRADELRSFVPRALDPAEPEALHDMRIAAKRLRYLLEVMEPALGPEAGKAAGRARDLQDVIGDIHDCDVMLPRVHARMAALDAEAGPRDPAYRGLAVFAADLRTRRARLFDDFRALWEEIEAGGSNTLAGWGSGSRS